MANANTDDFDLDTGDYIRLTSTQQSAKLIHTRMGDLIADLNAAEEGRSARLLPGSRRKSRFAQEAQFQWRDGQLLPCMPLAPPGG